MTRRPAALAELPRSFDKARSDLAGFQNIQVELQDVQFDNRQFTCERKPVLWSETPCAKESVVVLPAQTT